MVTEKIFEAALGISSPWFIAGMNFEPSQRKLNIQVDFEVGSRFAVPGDRAVLQARHALYQHARARHTRNWNPITVVTLNPERDAVIRAATESLHKTRSAA